MIVTLTVLVFEIVTTWDVSGVGHRSEKRVELSWQPERMIPKYPNQVLLRFLFISFGLVLRLYLRSVKCARG